MMTTVMLTVQMVRPWYKLLMLTIVNCGLVVAPDSDKNDKPAIAHIDALQGTTRISTL